MIHTDERKEADQKFIQFSNSEVIEKVETLSNQIISIQKSNENFKKIISELLQQLSTANIRLNEKSNEIGNIKILYDNRLREIIKLNDEMIKSKIGQISALTKQIEDLHLQNKEQTKLINELQIQIRNNSQSFKF